MKGKRRSTPPRDGTRARHGAAGAHSDQPEASPLQAAAAAHQAGDLERARALYRVALEADPGNSDALHLLGILESQQGNHEAALELIGRAIARQDRTAAFHSSLGQVYGRLGRNAEAEAAYRQALRLDPALADAH